MKTLFIYFKYPFFKQGSYFQEFLNKFAEKTVKVYLLASKFPSGPFSSRKNINYFWLPLVKVKIIDEIFFIFFAFFAVIFNRKLHHVDMVNSIGPRGLLAGWYLKKRFFIPLVCTIEIINENDSFLHGIYYKIFKLLITHLPIDHIICWSNYYWENHLKKWGVPSEKVSIVPGGIDLSPYKISSIGTKIKNQYAPDCPLIVFAKPLYPMNTISARILVEAVSFLRSKRKVKVLLGSGPGKTTIEKFVQKLGVSDLISFMPQVSFVEIPKYVLAADLIVLPFTYAPTTSRSLLEAMAAKKPIITSPIGEINNILENNKNAILVEPKPEIVSKEIKRLLENILLADKLARNAYLLVKERFDLNEIVSQTIAVLNNQKRCL